MSLVSLRQARTVNIKVIRAFKRLMIHPLPRVLFSIISVEGAINDYETQHIQKLRLLSSRDLLESETPTAYYDNAEAKRIVNYLLNLEHG